MSAVSRVSAILSLRDGVAQSGAAPSVYVTCIRFAFERSSMHVAYHVAAQHVHLCVKNNVCEMASCTACISLSAKKRDGVTATRRRALRDVHLPPLGVVRCECASWREKTTSRETSCLRERQKREDARMCIFGVKKHVVLREMCIFGVKMTTSCTLREMCILSVSATGSRA